MRLCQSLSAGCAHQDGVWLILSTECYRESGFVQQSFCPPPNGPTRASTSAHGIAEISELCDVSGMALLSRFPAHRGSTASRMLQSQSKERAMGELERNRQNVVAFYDLMFNQCRPSDAIARARTSTAP
jgi:hypothetical protein